MSSKLIMPRDFFPPIYKWTDDNKENDPKWKDGIFSAGNRGDQEWLIQQGGNFKYIKEDSTKRIYANLPEDPSISWAVFSIPVHIVTSIINVAYRALKFISLSHLWLPNPNIQEEKNTFLCDFFMRRYDNFQSRIFACGEELFRIILTPIFIVGLELSAIYGVFQPRNGRTLYAAFERAAYGVSILSYAYQPYNNDPRQPRHNAEAKVVQSIWGLGYYFM